MEAVQNIANLLNEHDVARITGLSVASVRRWRLFRRGPKYLKLGAAVRCTSRRLLPGVGTVEKFARAGSVRSTCC